MQEFLGFAKQVASGMKYLEEHLVVHRDLVREAMVMHCSDPNLICAKSL